MVAAISDVVLDAFQSQISQRALIGALLTATTTALVGTWVVVRGLAFFGDALAHGVLPGIALAAIWGFDLTLGALVSALVMVGGVNLVNRTTRLSDDTGIGLLFVGMLALGVVIREPGAGSREPGAGSQPSPAISPASSSVMYSVFGATRSASASSPSSLPSSGSLRGTARSSRSRSTATRPKHSGYGRAGPTQHCSPCLPYRLYRASASWGPCSCSGSSSLPQPPLS